MSPRARSAAESTSVSAQLDDDRPLVGMQLR